MTDTTKTAMGPHVRRFVRSAWLLLIAQLLATGIALGATGWAAFYVADLRAERDSLRSQLEEMTARQPIYAEPAAEEVMAVEPEPVETAPVIDDVPPPVSPTPRPRVTTPPPIAATPRAPQTRAPETRTPAPEPGAPERPRRNTTYPGGLPGQGSNAEPPYVMRIPGRYDGGGVQAPNVNVDPGYIPRRPRRDPPQGRTPDPSQPPRDPVPPRTDTVPPTNRSPNDPVT